LRFSSQIQIIDSLLSHGFLIVYTGSVASSDYPSAQVEFSGNNMRVVSEYVSCFLEQSRAGADARKLSGAAAR